MYDYENITSLFSEEKKQFCCRGLQDLTLADTNASPRQVTLPPTGTKLFIYYERRPAKLVVKLEVNELPL